MIVARFRDYLKSSGFEKLSIYLTPLTRKTIDSQIVELKLTPVRSGGSTPVFCGQVVCEGRIKCWNRIFNFESLDVLYSHLGPIPLKNYGYGDVEMILGQDVFHCIRPLEYFKTARENTPITVRLPLGWVFSGPLPSTLGLISSCFKAVTQRETDSKLADQIRRWYDIESYWAYKQVEPHCAADA